jgi:hypothetical protein
LWDSFAVATAVISDSSDNYIIMAATQRLHYKDILVSKASTALLASRALSSGIDHFVFEGDAI